MKPPSGDTTASPAKLPIFEHDSFRAAAWQSALPIDGSHTHVEQERRIAQSVLNDPILCDHIRQDQRWCNALFARHNRQGLCGFEI